MDEETCKICDHMIKVCDRLGKKDVCEKTIQDFKDKKITIEEVMNVINKNFDQEKFYKTWDEIIDKEADNGSK